VLDPRITRLAQFLNQFLCLFPSSNGSISDPSTARLHRMSQIILYGLENKTRHNMFALEDAEEWAKYQRNALRYLRARSASAATLSTLESLPYSCCAAMARSVSDDLIKTNQHLLTLRVPVEVFVEIESEHGNWSNRIAVQFPEIAHALGRVGCNIWKIIAEVELDAENTSLDLIQSEDLRFTSVNVEHALKQARTLIVSHGAPAALDRVHTCFHGYLKTACERAHLPMPNSRPGTIELLGLLRQHGVIVLEPELQDLVNKTFRGVQKAVDAFETFRNEYSLAHPQGMLPEAEAILVINLTQAMLRYLDARLQ
jgi:hypothetical protein